MHSFVEKNKFRNEKNPQTQLVLWYASNNEIFLKKFYIFRKVNLSNKLAFTCVSIFFLHPRSMISAFM